MIKVIKPGSYEDRLPLGRLCEVLGKQIIEANANHTRRRVDLYREIEFKGRNFHVRVKFSVPFAAVFPPEEAEENKAEEDVPLGRTYSKRINAL